MNHLEVMYRMLIVSSVTLCLASHASADTRAMVRFGMMPLELDASSDMPLFGSEIDRAVQRYNAAASAFERQTGGRAPRIAAGDLGVAETLFAISPAIELGGSHLFARLEAPIGLGSDLTSIGVGLYPLGVQGRVGAATLYVTAGGIASWLDRSGDGDIGGLFVVRAAAGARFGKHLVAELGYGAFALGGTVNRDKLETMSIDELMSVRSPSEIVSAGESHSLVDVSLGVSF